MYIRDHVERQIELTLIVSVIGVFPLSKGETRGKILYH